MTEPTIGGGIQTQPVQAVPEVLACPPPSRALYLSLFLGLACAGAFGGVIAQLHLERDVWQETLSWCDTASCIQSLETRRVYWEVGGAVLTLMGTGTLLLLLPTIRERTRGLTPVDGARHSALLSRWESLAGQAGLRRQPRLVSSVRPSESDTRCYGYPGRYRVTIPAKLRDREDGLEARLRHELGHLRNGDVAWAEASTCALPVSLLAVVAPLLLVTTGLQPSLAVDYGLRGAAVVLMVWLSVRAVMRSREFEADQDVARSGAGEQIAQLLLAGQLSQSRKWWARLPLVGQLHPAPSARCQMLADPSRLAKPGALDGLLPAFVICWAALALHDALTSALLTSRMMPWCWTMTDTASAALLAASLGLTVRRAALAQRVCGRRDKPWALMGGVMIGAVLGGGCSVYWSGQTGDQAGRMLLTAVITATGVTMGLLADAALAQAAVNRLADTRTARAVWVPGLVVSFLTYLVVLRTVSLPVAAIGFPGALRLGPWPVESGSDLFGTVLAGLLLLVVGATVRPGVREPAAPPAWAVRRRPDTTGGSLARPVPLTALVLGGLAAAGVGCVAILLLRLGGAPTIPEQRVQLYVWTATASGIAWAAVWTRTMGPTAGAGAVLGIPTVAAAAGLAMPANLMLGAGTVPVDLALELLRDTVTTSLFGAVAYTAVLSLIPLGGPRPPRLPARLVVTALVAATAVGVTVAAQNLLTATRPVGVSWYSGDIGALGNGTPNPPTAPTRTSPSGSAPTTGPSAPAPSISSPSGSAGIATDREAARSYLTGTAVPLISRWTAVVSALAAVQRAYLRDPQLTEALRTSVVEPLAQLRTDMTAVTTSSHVVRPVHSVCLAAVDASYRQQEAYLSAVETSGSFAASQQYGELSSRHWRACELGLESLRAIAADE